MQLEKKYIHHPSRVNFSLSLSLFPPSRLFVKNQYHGVAHAIRILNAREYFSSHNGK